MHYTEIARAILVLALIVASATDLRWSKVFNWLTWPAIGLGILLGLLGGPASSITMLEGLVAGLAAGLIYMVFFRCGAGDAKLLMVVGSLCGPWFLLGTALYGGIAGFPLALFVMWRRGVMRYTLANFTANSVQRASGNRDVDIASNSKAGKMPYALAIALGAGATYLIYGWAGMKLG
ncbi:MAG TPA: A24 family peptidase [Armatimonadota bacterium]|jgi:Flp pilus assembly protein protease CpaA